MITIEQFLSNHFKDVIFTTNEDKSILFANGIDIGRGDILEEDINSFYAMDAPKQIIEMIRVILKSKNLT